MRVLLQQQYWWCVFLLLLLLLSTYTRMYVFESQIKRFLHGIRDKKKGGSRVVPGSQATTLQQLHAVAYFYVHVLVRFESERKHTQEDICMQWMKIKITCVRGSL